MGIGNKVYTPLPGAAESTAKRRLRLLSCQESKFTTCIGKINKLSTSELLCERSDENEMSRLHETQKVKLILDLWQ